MKQKYTCLLAVCSRRQIHEAYMANPSFKSNQVLVFRKDGYISSAHMTDLPSHYILVLFIRFYFHLPRIFVFYQNTYE